MNHSYPPIPQAVYPHHVPTAATNHHGHAPYPPPSNIGQPLNDVQNQAGHQYQNGPPHPPTNTDFQGHYHTPTRPIIVSSTPAPPSVVMAPPFVPAHFHNIQNMMPSMPYRQIHMHTPPPPPMMHHHTPAIPPPFYRGHSHTYSQPLTPPPAQYEQPSYHAPVTSINAGPVSVEARSPPTPVIPPVRRPVFIPPLPWYSAPGEPFPGRVRKITRKRFPSPSQMNQGIQDKPSNLNIAPVTAIHASINGSTESTASRPLSPETVVPSTTSTVDTTTPPPASGSKSSSEIQESVQSATPSSSPQGATPSIKSPVAVPYIPHIAVPRTQTKVDDTATKAVNGHSEEVKESDPQKSTEDKAPEPSVPQAPKSWADLVRAKTIKNEQNDAANKINAALRAVNTNVNGKPQSLSEMIKSFDIGKPQDTPFLQPRGLINTGNMCFMNAIFQMLVFCGPFYMFLDQVGKNVAHNFKSETPLMDAMILFMREFRPVEPGSKSGVSTPRSTRNGTDPNLAGEPFVPEFVYEALKGLKRFSSMRRGHQQDAEEFLGFLLDGLHEESVQAMKSISEYEKSPTNASEASEDSTGWLEVGHKQKTATTRTVGNITGVSPITKIFGGSLRSELRISGQKNSVTREPYQPLQLDIQAAHINSIVDALRHLTTPETLQGSEFKSARGTSAAVTKQIFIETLPPILILHLKRFQYDNAGGTQKIWKRIGYPIDLEIPKEVMSPARRTAQPEKYKLIGVIYHHGKSASGGHYTVDVRRQDGWIRMDDTIVKRVSEKEVVVDIGTQNTKPSKEKTEELQEGEWEEVDGSSGKSSNGYTSQGLGSDKVAYILFYSLAS